MNGSKLVSVSAALILGACAGVNPPTTVPPGGGGGTPGRLTLTCDFDKVAADTCDPKGASGKYVCHAYVGKASQYFVYPGIITVPQDARDVTVVWHLADQRYKFQDKDDGAFDFKPNGNPFSDGNTTKDHEGGSADGGSTNHYRVKFTPPMTGGYKYKYSLKFRVPGEVVCDPTITSSSN